MSTEPPSAHAAKLAYSQALSEVKTQIEHWKNVKEDYKSVTKQLETLPNKTTHTVMVPFGPLAFAPGKLIHTNELMVHLGDCWFADITCKQGLKIVDHRLKTVNKNLYDLDKTLKNFEKKSEFSEELDNTGEDSAFEIKEKVPQDYVHPSRRKRTSHVTGDNRVPEPPTPAASDSCFNDEKLMRRLDELERLEEEEDQMLLDSANSSCGDEAKESSMNHKHQVSKQNKFNKKKRVSWKHHLIEGRNADSDDSDDNSPATIRFKHSPAAKVKGENKDSKAGDVIANPGDIGRNATSGEGDSRRSVNANKSILKPSVPAGELSKVTLSDRPQQQPVIAQFQTAISDTVIEHQSADQQKPPVAEAQQPPKRVSKFKASRKR